VFCQASQVVDGVEDKPSLQKTISYIVSKINDEGFFVDNNPVIHREMQVIKNISINTFLKINRLK